MTDHHPELGARVLAYRPASPDHGNDVALLQTYLAELTYPVRADGDYGPATGACVRQFSTDRRLPVDGVFGPETLQELEKVRRVIRAARPHYLAGPE